MTPSQSTQPSADSSIQTSICPKPHPSSSLHPSSSVADLGRSVLTSLGLGLVGMGLTFAPIAQAQITGTDIKLLEPAGLAAVQAPRVQPPIVQSPNSQQLPSQSAVVPSSVNVPQESQTDDVPNTIKPETIKSETIQTEIEPQLSVVEKPDPLPPERVVAIVQPAPKKANKPAIVHSKAVLLEPTYAPVETATAPEPANLRWGPVTVDREGVQFSPPPHNAYFSGNFKLPQLPQLPIPSLSSLGMIFPLAIPAPISSLFGWRIHPITGEQQMHTGTDFAAPLGTPVLAALTGKVLLADFLGGYGLTIALEHGQGSQQTLYAHLSELFIKPGQVVQQGQVIGRVGTTGNTTGPHLHFEMRQQLPDGSWIAQDAGQQLEIAMVELTQALKIAQQPQIQPSQIPLQTQQSTPFPLDAQPQQVAQSRSTQSMYPLIPLKAQPNQAVQVTVPSLKVPTNIP